MRDVDLALTQVSRIHQQLLATTKFLGISPEFNLLLALLTLAVAATQSLLTPLQEGLAYITVWVSVILASTVVIAIEAIARARRLHGPLAKGMLRTALRKVAPFYLAGTFVTWALCTLAPDAIWILPGLWLMLIGLLGFAALPSLPPVMAWVAGWYLLCGAVAIVVAAGADSLSPWLMGIPFALGQLAIALIFSNLLGERHGGV